MPPLTEAECRYLELTLSLARELLRQSQRLKKQLVENLDKENEESRKLKEKFEEVEKSVSSASRKTPQQVGLFQDSLKCILLLMSKLILGPIKLARHFLKRSFTGIMFWN